MTVLGRNIKKYRELKGLTQDQVAKMGFKRPEVQILSPRPRKPLYPYGRAGFCFLGN